jgi:uncharacterized SAM-binding protein YcdF (DUF218 family)
LNARYLALPPLAVVPVLLFVDPPYTASPPPVRASAAVVLSGDVEYLRLQRAVELHKHGQVGVLLLTGAGVGGDSAVALAARARASGVPWEAMILEEHSTSTRENVVGAVAAIRAHGWTSVALVTSASHMSRALRAARRVAPDVAWLPVPVPDAGSPRRVVRTRVDEWVKLAWYAARGWI